MKLKKSVPYEFVLEELASLDPLTKSMFGAYGVYVDGKIVFILRQKETYPQDNGVWLATTGEHHASLQREFPAMRSIFMFTDGAGPTGWQNLPEESPDFEDAVLHACALVQRGDPRIGKIPKKKTPRKKAVRGKTKRRAK